MTTANRTAHRRGFTLIELLVVMALIAGLAAMAMVVAPAAINKDRTASAVTQIQGALQIARARAIRDGSPRGVRFIFNGSYNVTEYQYIETTPMVVPNTGGPIGVSPYATTTPPYIEFNYTAAAGPVTTRTCTFTGLDPTLHQPLIVPGNTLYLPTLGTWHRFMPGTAYPTAVLDTYPDQQLGAETRWRTYHFGLNGGIRTLLGEPTIPLPQGTCVDIAQSSPPVNNRDNYNYNILFTSSGLLDANSTCAGAGQVFLLVRDPSKGNPVVSPSPNPATYSNAGEMLVVSIKAKTGGIGGAPVDWGGDPFILARKSLSGQ